MAEKRVMGRSWRGSQDCRECRVLGQPELLEFFDPNFAGDVLLALGVGEVDLVGAGDEGGFVVLDRESFGRPSDIGEVGSELELVGSSGEFGVEVVSGSGKGCEELETLAGDGF